MFSGSSGSPDLRFGMTSADFHACAKQFDANEELMRFVMTGKVDRQTPQVLHSILENKEEAIGKYHSRKQKETVICPPTCSG